MSETFWTQVPKVLKAHETSSTIDQEEWQPALEWWDGCVKVKFLGGPHDGMEGFANSRPDFLTVDRDGASYDEYERTTTVYGDLPDGERGTIHLEYTYRRTVSK